MGRIGVTITKSTLFRGVQQEFGNTYYYEVTGTPAANTALELIGVLVALEKPMYAASVSFLRARAWSAGGTAAQNQLLATSTLSGTGTNGNQATTIDKERAFLVRFRAGNDSKGRPVYLRKWWHLDVSVVGGAAISNNTIANTSGLTQAQRDQLVTWANQFKTVGITGDPTFATLVSKTGRQIDGSTVAHPYFEHHQLGDMWR